MRQDEYENKLQALGCQKLGSGLYSNVYSIPGRTDKVIKVGDCDRWTDYIAWATKNGHAGKFAPKVYSLKFHDGFYVAIMERLVCTIKEMGQQSEQYQIYNKIWHEEECPAPDLTEYVQELDFEGLAGDLHNGNVMVRHDGQLVITDPCAGSGSSRFRIKNGTCL